MGTDLTITGPVEHQGASLLQIVGRLSAEGAVKLREYCSGYRTVNKAPLLIDCSEVTFVASSGIGTLLLVTDAFSEAQQQVVFYNLSEVVDQVIDCLNLHEFLCIATDLKGALSLVCSTSDPV